MILHKYTAEAFEIQHVYILDQQLAIEVLLNLSSEFQSQGDTDM